MAVPDTYSFTLKDVTSEVDLYSDGISDLQDSFDHALDYLFDDRYQGDKSSLRNFRNYGSILPPVCTTLYAVESGFGAFGSILGRFEADGGSTSEDHQGKYSIDYFPNTLLEIIPGVYNGEWTVNRLYCRFDFISIPEFWLVDECTLEFDITHPFRDSNSTGWSGEHLTLPRIVKLNYVALNDQRLDPFPVGDWSETTEQELFMTKSYTPLTADPKDGYHVVCTGNDYDRGTIAGLFGRSFQFCMKEPHDFRNDSVDWDSYSGLTTLEVGGLVSNLKLTVKLKRPI